MITKGGNYGWPIYEGPYPYKPANAPERSTSSSSKSLIFPVMGYNHSEAYKTIGSASIIGGYFYRSQTDPCLYGRFASLFFANKLETQYVCTVSFAQPGFKSNFQVLVHRLIS